MEKKDVKFELENVFLLDAADVFSARQKAQLIHKSTNIRSAGDEVEEVFRQVMRRRLPEGIHVGQGHVIDENCNCSGQFDLVIADKFGCPIFFRTENGTEYFPFEAVYALGEVRSSYQSKDEIKDYIEKVTSMKRRLSRENTPRNFISVSRGRGFQMIGMQSADKRPFKNPLFSFIVFIDSQKFQLKHLKQLFQTTPLEDLPNLICFLDRGVIAYSLFGENRTFAGVHDQPQFANLYEPKGSYSEWIWLREEDQNLSFGSNLGWLYFTLSNHIRNCMLMPPDLMNYGRHALFSGSTRYDVI